MSRAPSRVRESRAPPRHSLRPTVSAVRATERAKGGDRCKGSRRIDARSGSGVKSAVDKSGVNKMKKTQSCVGGTGANLQNQKPKAEFKSEITEGASNSKSKSKSDDKAEFKSEKTEGEGATASKTESKSNGEGDAMSDLMKKQQAFLKKRTETRGELTKQLTT